MNSSAAHLLQRLRERMDALPAAQRSVVQCVLEDPRAAVAATAAHLKNARFEHLGQSLGESLPTLRAQLATMQIETDGLSSRVDDLADHLEHPRDTTLLRVLETKAAAGDIAIGVTSTAMRVCGGSAFSKHLSVERLFRDAHAGAVMAPTGDVLRESIGKAILGLPLF